MFLIGILCVGLALIAFRYVLKNFWSKKSGYRDIYTINLIFATVAIGIVGLILIVIGLGGITKLW
jgi:hypothetical protein